MGRERRFRWDDGDVAILDPPASARTEEAEEDVSASVRLSVPEERQATGYSCGAACLTSVARFFGVEPDTESEAIRELKSSPAAGSDPEHIVQVAHNHGLEGVALSGLTLADLREHLDQGHPIIVPLQAWGTPEEYASNESGHYTVVVGMDEENVWVMDPARFTPGEERAEYGTPGAEVEECGGEGGKPGPCPEQGGKDAPKGKDKGSKPAKGPRVPEQQPNQKALLAKQTHKPSTKAKQDHAKANQDVVAKGVGGQVVSDNAPTDVTVPRKGGGVHGVEVKTMVDNGNSRVKMNKGAYDRKAKWSAETGNPLHTSVTDDRDVFDGGKNKDQYSGNKLYYKRGGGSFAVNGMHPVKDHAEMARLMELPDDKLPELAKPLPAWTARVKQASGWKAKGLNKSAAAAAAQQAAQGGKS